MRPLRRRWRKEITGLVTNRRFCAHSRSQSLSISFAIAQAILSVTVWAETRPNVILILADDMGYSDLGCFGSEISTPNIDRLAYEGIRFTQFYNAARCNPTRAALLTGRYPHQVGVGFSNIGAPAYSGRINRRSVTIAEVLRDAGYATLMSGKWHLGDNRPNWPIDRGFEHFFGLIGGASSYWEVLPQHRFHLAIDDQLWQPPQGDNDFYLTDSITDHAISFLEKVASEKQPFFLYLPFTAPHWPLHAHSADIEKYRGTYLSGWDQLRRSRYRRMRELGVIPDDLALSPREEAVPAWSDINKADRKLWDLRMAVYAAMIDRMDYDIGRLMERLKSLGCDQNTLVLFLSDNGGCEVDPRRDTGGSDPSIPPGPRGGFWGYGRPWANASNTPFRKYKRFIYEGGISTPLLCWWPRRIVRPGRVDPQVGHVVDLMATVLEVTGAKYPETYGGHEIAAHEGLSLAPSFSNEPREVHDFLFWEHYGNRGVRAGDWKLVSGRNGPWELYNIAVDHTELNNQADAKPDIVDSLAHEYDRWAREVGVLPWSLVRQLHERQLSRP